MTTGATERWRQHNMQARAAGCNFGQPATHVRYVRGTVGAVPAEIWSCADHVNVNGWAGYSDGSLKPKSDYTEADLAWVSQAVRAPAGGGDG